MEELKLLEQLESMFGNPLGPKKYAIVRDAIVMIWSLVDENAHLRNILARHDLLDEANVEGE